MERLRGITDTLPNEYKPGLAGGGGVGIVGGMNDEEAIKGIQQANICITALCAEFALVSRNVTLLEYPKVRRCGFRSLGWRDEWGNRHGPELMSTSSI